MKPLSPIRPISISVAFITACILAYSAVLLSSSIVLSGSAAADAIPSGATSNKDILVASLRKGTTTNVFAIARVRGNRVVGYAGTMNSSDMACFSGRVKANRFHSDKGAVVAGTGTGSSLRIDRIGERVKPNKYKWVKLQPSTVQELARLSTDSKRHMYSVIDTCAAGGVLGY